MTNDPTRSDTVPHPSQVAAEAFRAIEQGRWEDLASLVDPADVQRFRDEQVRLWTEPRLLPTITVEQLRRHEPEMPQAVAEYQAEQFQKRQQEFTTRISAEFAGVDSPAQLESLSAIELLARHLQARSPEARVRALLAMQGRTLPAELSREAMLGPHYAVIGSVAEGESLAHVVYRMQVGPVPDAGGMDQEWMEAPLRVASLKRTPAGWRLKLTHDLFGLEGWGAVGVDPDEASPED